MKYIIDIEDEYTKDWVNETKELCVPISVPTLQRTYHVITGFKLEPYTDPDRKAIEDEVWENTWKMFLTPEDFGATMGDSYSEAKAKYDVWKEEIHVGDEVQSKYGPLKGIVTKIDKTGLAIISIDGASDGYVPESFYRTGRHFSEIKKIMEKLENDK